MSDSPFVRTRHFGRGIGIYSELLSHIDVVLHRRALAMEIELDESRMLLQRDMVIFEGPRGLEHGPGNPPVGILLVGAGRLRKYPVRSVVKGSTPELTAVMQQLRDADIAIIEPDWRIEAFCPGYTAFVLRLIPLNYGPRSPLKNKDTLVASRNNIIDTIVKCLLLAEVKAIVAKLEAEKPKDIFLSHKGIDKPFVKNIRDTLREIGFSTWLDEDRMPAGTPLERAIYRGMVDSCAAVFFVTTNFRDEGYLETEVNYTVQQKREKGNRFSTMCMLLRGGTRELVPDLLKGHVHFEVNEETKIREIVRGLPIKLGPPSWKFQ